MVEKVPNNGDKDRLAWLAAYRPHGTGLLTPIRPRSYDYTSLNSEHLALFQYQALFLTASTILALSLPTPT